MTALFWLSFVITGYTYIGYALVLALLAKVRREPIQIAPIKPTVSIVMAAHNEQERLPAKLANLLALKYPRELIQIVIVSDGSTDETAEIIQQHAACVTPVILANAHGKAAALNEGVRRATGEILVFFDVRQTVDTDAVAELVSCFADPQVGAVSGELLLESAPGQPSGEALGIYWKIEKMVRKLESQTGSVVGVTGAIYAMRRELFVEMPVGTLLDDVMVPMNVVRQGYRVVFQPQAVARDLVFAEPGKEFRRKVRTLTGNYQLLRLAPWLLSSRNPLLFRLVSHKLLRLVIPFFLIVMLFSSAIASSVLLHVVFALQLGFYGLAAIGALSKTATKLKPVAIAHTFVVLNAAAVLALRNFVLRRDKVWV